MTYRPIHDRLATATRLAAYGDAWPSTYATEVAPLLAAAEGGPLLDADRLTAIRNRVIDARGAYPWPGGRWAGWYADDASALLEDLPVTV